MAIALEKLLSPVSDEAPSGEDLAYDPERSEIEQAFESSVSVDTTGAATAETEVDWRRIIGLIERQSARTKDLWLAVYLCRAAAKNGDLGLIVTGAEFLAGLCDTFWESAHPQIDEYGFQGRKTPCESLARRAEFLGPLRRVPVLSHPRLGAFSGDDLERFATAAEAAEGYGVFRAALSETPEEALQAAVQRFDAIGAAIRRVDAVLMEKAEGDTGANFATTYQTLKELREAVLKFCSAPVVAQEEPEPEADGISDAPTGAAPTPRTRLSGEIGSREDVLKALDAISDYYRRNEPTSPVPLVLKRAREWVNRDFLDLLTDIAPDALGEAKKLLFARDSS
jgi:type VI secretion system ImpA family protein